MTGREKNSNQSMALCVHTEKIEGDRRKSAFKWECIRIEAVCSFPLGHCFGLWDKLQKLETN